MIAIFVFLPLFWIVAKFAIWGLMKFSKDNEYKASNLSAVLTLFVVLFFAYLLLTYKDM